MLEIEVDAPKRLARLIATGFVSVADVEGAEEDLRLKLPLLGWRPGSYRLLVDNRRRDVASQEVVERIRIFLATTDIAPGKVAVLVSNTLTKLQSKRLAPSNPVFFDEDEALAWLASDCSFDAVGD